MEKEIILDDIKKYHNNYNKNELNKEIEKKIYEKGILKACLNDAYIHEQQYDFNLEIPECKIYNQKNGYQCNIYAFLRVIKNNVAYNLNMNINDVDLSASFIEFYDKLEKINTLYNDLIDSEEFNLYSIREKVDQYIGIYGTFHYCVKIVQKYGLVPNEFMKDTSDHYDAIEMLELLKDKVKSDALILISAKKEGKDLLEIKDKLMEEAYTFLSKVLGNPPVQFNYREKGFTTPLEFKDKYLTLNLNDFVTVTSFDGDVFMNSYSFIPNVYLEDSEEIITMELDDIKRAIINQLKDGTAVWFSAEESKTLDYDLEIISDKLYDLKNTLNINEMSKEQGSILDTINYDHTMCITGAKITNDGLVTQFKVDNSFGVNGNFKGHLIMPISFFDKYVITVILNKKYL